VASDGAGGGAGVGAKLEVAESRFFMPSLFMMSMTRSTASPPICKPKLPPPMVKKAERSSLWSAATGDAFTVPAADNEPAFEQRGNDSHTLGEPSTFLRDALVGRALDFVETVAADSTRCGLEYLLPQRRREGWSVDRDLVPEHGAFACAHLRD